MLTITESIQQQLQVPLLERRKAVLAEAVYWECDVVGPIELRF